MNAFKTFTTNLCIKIEFQFWPVWFSVICLKTSKYVQISTSASFWLLSTKTLYTHLQINQLYCSYFQWIMSTNTVKPEDIITNHQFHDASQTLWDVNGTNVAFCCFQQPALVIAWIMWCNELLQVARKTQSVVLAIWKFPYPSRRTVSFTKQNKQRWRKYFNVNAGVSNNF